MILGVLGNITVIIYTIFLNKELKDSDILLGRKLGTGRSFSVFITLSNMDH